MKTILVFVCTLDAKVTKGDNPVVRDWASPEDQQYFKRVWRESKLTVMGSASFDADPITPSALRLVLVMTRRPNEYEQYVVPGQVEFTDASPSQIVEKYADGTYDQLLVAGGPSVATSFLKDKLIDELWLTFEPLLFGHGKPFITDESIDVKLTLLSSERINDNGTLLNKYRVLRSL